MTLGQKAADALASWVGSWKFIFFQTFLLSLWIFLNASGILTWDSHPFIFLTLLLGIQAAYTAPIILMSQNRAEERDRKKFEIDLATDRKSEREIKIVQDYLLRIEREKLDEILRILKSQK